MTPDESFHTCDLFSEIPRQNYNEASGARGNTYIINHRKQRNFDFNIFILSFNKGLTMYNHSTPKDFF